MQGAVDVKQNYGGGALAVDGHVEGWVSFANGNFNVEGRIRACGFWGGICFGAEGWCPRRASRSAPRSIPAINLYFVKTPALRAGAGLRWDDISHPSFMVAVCDIGPLAAEHQHGPPPRGRRARR